MEYTVENYGVLFTKEYSNSDEFKEEFEIVKGLLEINAPEEITLTTGEDGELEQYNSMRKMSMALLDVVPLKETVSAEFNAYNLHEIDGVKFVISRYPFDAVFLKVTDKEQFEKLIEKY